MVKNVKKCQNHCTLMSAPIYKKGEVLKKLAALHLFVETLPIYKAVATGNGNDEF
jgi:hypothetical protein